MLLVLSEKTVGDVKGSVREERTLVHKVCFATTHTSLHHHDGRSVGSSESLRKHPESCHCKQLFIPSAGRPEEVVGERLDVWQFQSLMFLKRGRWREWE